MVLISRDYDKVIDHNEPVVPTCSSDRTEGALFHYRGAGEPVAAVADEYTSGSRLA